MKISILGTGCAKCRRLAENAAAAIVERGADCELEKITDIESIMSYGVMTTPAMVIDGQVAATGKVLSVAEIKKFLPAKPPAQNAEI